MDLMQHAIPLYYQLKSIIKHKIETREWPPGATIPSERELEHKYQLSRTTVRQAIGELAREGWLERRHGKGTFVIERQRRQTTTTLLGLVERLKQLHLSPRIEMFSYECGPAPSEVTTALHLEEGTEMILVKRRIWVKNVCLIADENYFNSTLSPFMTEEHLASRTIYELLDSHGVQVYKGSQSFTAAQLDNTQADYLLVEPGTPALIMKTILFNNRQTALQYSVSYCNPIHYHHEIWLAK